MGAVRVFVAAAPEAVFDYLADPANRPAWQGSLRAVEPLDDGPPRVGYRWRDLTVVGVEPEMAITVFDRPARWAEVGRWRGLEAVLVLSVEPAPGGTSVHASFRLTGWGPVSTLLGVLALPAVRHDLRRAGRLISDGGPEAC